MIIEYENTIIQCKAVCLIQLCTETKKSKIKSGFFKSRIEERNSYSVTIDYLDLRGHIEKFVFNAGNDRLAAKLCFDDITRQIKEYRETIADKVFEETVLK